MIDCHFWPTPNGWKVTIALEEMALPYRVVPVDIGRGDQFTPEFRRISPSARMPAIVDHEPPDGGGPLALFESGVILRYLAEKTGRFFPRELRARYEAEQWLSWQMSQLGPVMGQHGHFALYAREKIPYAVERYRRETLRLLGVLDERLAGREHVCGEYTVVDMACWPWVLTYRSQGIDLDVFPNVRRWYDALKARPALRRGYDVMRERRMRRDRIGYDETARRYLFGEEPGEGQRAGGG